MLQYRNTRSVRGKNVFLIKPKAEGQTATCDKAGSPNDVCPYWQVMSASPNDVAFGCDVVPTAQWANITSLRPSGATSLRTK
jgi:hypothetical protein